MNQNLRILANFFGTVNPVWLRQSAPDDVHAGDREWYGCEDTWRAAYGDAALASFPPLLLPNHVFPVVSEVGPGQFLGLTVPVSAVPRDRWHVSDAFGRFVKDCDSVDTSFEWLVETVEDKWHSKWGTVLPLRWRQPFAFQVLATVHLGSIGGVSLQWPLAVALLRAAASGGNDAQLPFGRGPVFATGTVMRSGVVGWVQHVREKLCGFCREFGTERPVLLTSMQFGALRNLDGCHREFFDRLDIRKVNSFHDLFELPEFRGAREALTAPPRSTELDQFMMAMDRDDAGIRFEQVAKMVEWLLPASSEQPAYAFRLRYKRGQVRLHRGDAPSARADWEAMDTLLEQFPDQFGAADHIRLAAAWGIYWMDAGDPAEGLRRLDAPNVVGALPHADLGTRAEWHGVVAELSRTSGDYDRAVAEGERALRAAEAGHSQLVGRMANHTVHALICRARAGQGVGREDDLHEARIRLDWSMREYAPLLDPRARDFQLGFCRPLDAEWHRLSELPYEPEFRDARLRIWDHPHLFTLLSAARNPANDLGLRRRCAIQLCEGAEAMQRDHQGVVFAVLAGVYGVVRAHLMRKTLETALVRLEDVLSGLPGMPGWQRRLQPALDRLRAAATDVERQAALDLLCDNVPHH